jgi:3-ketosteroid 9alpha-monooxygenase subunit A
VKSPHALANADDVVAARMFQEASRLAFAQDFEVWAHKAPALKILQVNSDGPFHLERIWYKQFFNRRAREAEFQKRVGGLHRIKGPPLTRAAAAGA